VRKLFRLGMTLLAAGLLMTGCKIVHQSEDPAFQMKAEEQQQYASGKPSPKINPLLTQEESDKLSKLENKHIIYRGAKGKKVVALTFDDGPDPQFTPQILEILRRYNVKATFFLLGQRVQTYPHLVKQEVDEGHIVASHSWEHKYLPNLSPEALKEDLKKTKDAIKMATGKDILMLRPPYGAAKGIEELLKKEGYMILNWDVDTLDWEPGRTPQQIMDVIQKQTSEGSIILFHDAGGNRSTTVATLPQVIETLQQQGYQFVTIDQLLGVRAFHNE